MSIFKEILKFAAIFLVLLVIVSTYFAVKFIAQNGQELVSIAEHVTANNTIDPTNKSHTFAININNAILIIPKINATAPMIFPATFDADHIAKHELFHGVVWYSNSVLPGQKGTAVILGHSANESTPKLPYINIFTRLKELQPGDTIIIRNNNKDYTFKVNSQLIFSPKGQEPDFKLSNGANIILVTCWPDGHPWQRLGVSASLI